MDYFCLNRVAFKNSNINIKILNKIQTNKPQDILYIRCVCTPEKALHIPGKSYKVQTMATACHITGISIIIQKYAETTQKEQ